MDVDALALIYCCNNIFFSSYLGCLNLFFGKYSGG